MKKILWISMLLLSVSVVNGQQLADIKVDKLYSGWLNEVLEDIAKEHKVRFVYDVEKLSRLSITERPFKQSLDDFLETICQPRKLKFFQAEDGAIHILGRYENPNAQAVAKTKSYTGAAKRKNITVEGIVQDAVSGEHLPFVSVKSPGSKAGSSSNVDGYFTVLEVPSDTSTLVFSYLGYEPVTLFLTPELNLKGLLIEMHAITAQISEITISAERAELMQTNKEVSMLKMTPSQIAALPSLGEKDIFRSFQLMPGISAANEHTSGLYVRGGTPDQALTLFDGITVYNVDHLFGFYSAFNANAVKDVQLYKGAFDSKFGGRLSSVAEITGKDGNNRGFNMGGDVSFLSANVYLEQPMGEKVTTIVAARRSWKGPLYNKVFDRFSGESEENTSPFANQFGSSVTSYFYDLNAKVTWRPTTKDVISFSFYNGTDKLDNSIRPQLPSFLQDQGVDFSINITDLTKWGNTGSSLKWSRRWSDRFYNNTLVSYSQYFSRRDRSVDGNITNADGEEETIKRGTFEDNDLRDLTVKSDFEWKLNKSNQMEFGGFITNNDIKYTYAQNDTSTVIDRSTKGNLYGGYVQDRVQLFNNKLVMTPGLRLNYFDQTRKNYYEPRVNVQWQMTDKIKLKGSAGRYYQFAKRVIREDVLQGSRDFWVLADNDRLPVSRNDQFVLGASYENKDWLFDVEAYHKDLSGLSEYSLRFTPTFNNISYEEAFYQGTGIAQGIDFLVQKKYGKWNGWIGYTIGDVRNNFPVYGAQDFYAANDVTHEFKIINLYKWHKWDFSATWIFASGRPYTAPTGGYQVELLNGETQDVLNVSSKNGLRLPDYHRFDVAATYHFFLGTAPSSLGFSIFNLYNRRNVWYKTFEIIDNQVVGTDVNYLGLTPNITFSFKLR
ncbi:MAG: TonB-dependent receptor [Saprospiraceae bacterium]|nr:TonB-dependent receptor [Saprospiraceae bacterium]